MRHGDEILRKLFDREACYDKSTDKYYGSNTICCIFVEKDETSNCVVNPNSIMLSYGFAPFFEHIPRFTKY
jgi:hypothetical protein